MLNSALLFFYISLSNCQSCCYIQDSSCFFSCLSLVIYLLVLQNTRVFACSQVFFLRRRVVNHHGRHSIMRCVGNFTCVFLSVPPSRSGSRPERLHTQRLGVSRRSPAWRGAGSRLVCRLRHTQLSASRGLVTAPAVLPVESDLKFACYVDVSPNPWGFCCSVVCRRRE